MILLNNITNSAERSIVNIGSVSESNNVGRGIVTIQVIAIPNVTNKC